MSPFESYYTSRFQSLLRRILCTGIIGGAFVSLLVGWLGDQLGLRMGMMFLYLTLGYILAIGLWARPLINNATITPKELLFSLPRALSARGRSEGASG